MDYSARSLTLHHEKNGKIEIISRVPVENRDDLSLAYTPGVAAPCLAIRDDPAKSYELTRRSNLIAVVTDGTAVLGLGDIGPEAGMPVMEGKCVLFKAFGGVDAVPLCIRSKDPDEIVRTVSLLAGSFGGINLEDISAPRCFEIESRLIDCCDIPVFHDDQHGTAVVVSAALENALRVTGKRPDQVRIVQNGIGAAGSAIARLLLTFGYPNLTLCDRTGILTEDTPGLDPLRKALAGRTNPEKRTGTLADAVCGADVFIGTSAPGCLTPDMVRSMAKDPIVFALANPTPEISEELAREAGAAVVGNGRSDCPNQINNLLAFPGIFRGALDVRASRINEPMKIAAAHAIASCLPPDQLSPECIIPSPLDRSVAARVAEAVAQAARDSGVARI